MGGGEASVSGPIQAFIPPSSAHSLRLASLATSAYSITASTAYRKASQLTIPFIHRLDQVQELGGSVGLGAIDHVGHSGCVNALCWSESGELLASGSDDTRVILWRLGTSHIHPVATQPPTSRHRSWIGVRSANRPEQNRCEAPSLSHPSLDVGMSAVIATGHTANIFSVAFAPHSGDARLFTAAGDSQIRIFDLNRSDLGSRYDVGSKWFDRYDQFPSEGAACRTLRCHRRRAKRLGTENSPDVFLSVAEDGDVRSHDLRTHHECRSNCPRPLLHSPTSLYSLSVSPLQPYLFAVAGVSPYSYLYDRRMIGRVLEDEWGMPIQAGEQALLTKCVRRFGLPRGRWNKSDCQVQDAPTSARDVHGQATPAPRPARRLRRARVPASEHHITAVKLGDKGSGELLATYSGGGVYRFNINDEPGNLQHKHLSTFESSEAFKADVRAQQSFKDHNCSNEADTGDAENRRQQRPKPEEQMRPVEAPIVGSSQGLTSLASEDSENSEATDMRNSDQNLPTEQELIDTTLYRQLMANDGGADLESSTAAEEGDADENMGEDGNDSEEHDDGSNRNDSDGFSVDFGSEIDYDPLPPTNSGHMGSVDPALSSVPIVYPRQRFTGHLNIETVKEVNFLGTHDEYVVSGSDDGNFFVWDSHTAELLGIWQGDGSVVNVVVPHPTLPVLAVSGIDDTVKLFGPVDVPVRPIARSNLDDDSNADEEDRNADVRRYSRWNMRQRIVRRNERRTIRIMEDMDSVSSEDDDDDDDEGASSSRYLHAALAQVLSSRDSDQDSVTPPENRLRIMRQEDGTLVITRDGLATERASDNCAVM